MKKISAIIGMLILIVASFSSCKKERVYARHIFWFNKATSDSLKAAGVATLHFLPVDYKTGGDDRWFAKTDVDYWYGHEPEFDEYGMLSASIVIDKGETKTFKYNITAQQTSTNSTSFPVEILQHMPMAQGSFEMGHGTTTYTQLIWQ